MSFFLQIDGQSEGPFTVEEIEDLHGAGRVNRSTPCRAAILPTRQKQATEDSEFELVAWLVIKEAK
jgi:hypothetical protein